MATNTDDEVEKESQDNCQVLESFFKDLGLMPKYFPQHLTISDGLCVKEKTLNAVSCNQVKELPWLVLQKIMSYDSRSRTSLLKLPKASSSEEEFSSDDSDEDDEKMSNQLVYYPDRIHPMDVILALFLCADDFLRQDMMVRLQSCQLAIPLVLRDPFTQELTLPLWALSSIVKSWSTVDSKNKIENFEGQLTNYAMPIVSIMRLGNHKVSKSKLLNNVISSNNQHNDYFFHRDCNGGSFRRLLGNGIIDLCWYLPSGEEDIFPNIAAFVNLHGDACDSMNKKQVEFLSKISTLCFVLAAGKSLDDTSISILKKFQNFTLLIKGRKPNNLDEEFPEVHAISLRRNEDEIKISMRDEINSRVFCEDARKQNIHLLIHECLIKVDSKRKYFVEGKEIASRSIDKINFDDPKFKAKNLPLQGKAMWQEWATNDKEQKRQMNRGNKDIKEYEGEIGKEKARIRAIQMSQLTQLSPIMKLFIENFKNIMEFEVLNYYLHCLKIHLNNISRDTISQVHIEYRDALAKLMEYEKTSGAEQQDPNCKEKEPLREKLDELHGKLIELAFGLEHLLRETAQIYETSIERETPKAIREEFSALPSAASKLLRNGYPLEVMDGDAAHVPIKWVQAVLNELAEELGNPKIFVLSVLGLQSTGKSTLLNTVFGLQFNVSSGRCTRGAYMQLLPISEEIKEDVDCEYILVIDTEGLRSPELDSFQSQKHDNELATFVIGLADDTLINIYGQVAGDMDDILQTCVHAFIRMREVKRLKPSCQFVHQNASGAGSRTGIGRDKFIQKLDEMTRYAASDSGCPDQFQHFRDVIKFNDQTDVHHFECLWMGDPPMAPVNPGYSRSAQALKLHIIKQIRETECTSLSSFSTKMEDLWDALLAENFVFSFKNSLEIQAYSNLESMYSEWEWELKEEVLKWEERMEEVVKKASADTQALDDIISKKLNRVSGELVVLIMKTHDRLHEKLAKHFKQSKQSDIIAQWKATFERRLQQQANLLKDSNLSHFEQLCTGQKALTNVRQQQDLYKQRIISKVTEIADVLKGQSTILTERQVTDEFDKAWNEIIENLQPVHTPQDPGAVRGEVEQELIGFLGAGSERMIVEFQISQKDGDEADISLKLKINRERHLSYHPSLIAWFKNKIGLALSNNDINRAQDVTDVILEIVPQFLKKSTYSRAQVAKMLKDLCKVIDKQSASEKRFVFTQQYRADLYLTACNYAICQFEQMVEAFNRKNDPVVCLENELKDDLFDIFKNKCFQIGHVKAVASTLNDILKKSIMNKVKSSLARQIVGKMKAADISFKNKQALKAKILVNLAEDLQKNKDLKPFVLYFTNPKQSFQNWAKEYTKQYCDACEPGNRLSHVQVIAVDEITDLFERTKEQVKKLCIKYESSHSTLSTSVWLSEFSADILKEIGCHVDVSTLQKTSEGQKIDVANFTATVEEDLNIAGEKLITLFEKLKFDDMQSWEKRAEDILGDMAGCCAQCPFCGDICDNTNPCEQGVKHQIEQHRFNGTLGWRGMKNKVLSLGICSTLVTGYDEKATHFVLGEDKRSHLYKEYRTVYPDWNIPASLTGSSSYWKWFAANYITELANYYSCNIPKIPFGWKQLKWEHVKEELERKYVMKKIQPITMSSFYKKIFSHYQF